MQDKPYTLHYEMNGISLGSRRVVAKWNAVHRHHEAVFSRIYYCQHCGSVFARARLEPACEWTAEMGICAECPQGVWEGIIPGSLLKFHHSDAALRLLPPPLLQHEFEVHMTWAESRVKGN